MIPQDHEKNQLKKCRQRSISISCIKRFAQLNQLVGLLVYNSVSNINYIHGHRKENKIRILQNLAINDVTCYFRSAVRSTTFTHLRNRNNTLALNCAPWQTLLSQLEFVLRVILIQHSTILSASCFGMTE